MRDLALVSAMLFYVPVSLRFPAAGILCWVWFSIMNPHRQVYGFALGQPFNSVIAVATLVGWLAGREPKRWTRDAMPWMLLLLVVWMTLGTAVSPFPSYSWTFWDRVMRTVVPVFLVFFIMNTKARIHALVWIIVISLGFYGVKGGIFTIRGGGHAIVYGPDDSVYSDNNQLALAIVTSLPLLFYLAQYTRSAWLRIPMLVAMGLQVMMVFGSYSRGGVIALFTMLLLLWLRSDRKIIYGVLAAAVVAGGLSLMPAEFFDRLHTVNSLNTDDSFQGRLNAWKVAYLYATDHFPFGAGFYAPQLPNIFNHYLPDADNHAAHSIYFQILGEHGYVGLAIYVVILLLGLYNASKVCGQTKGKPGLRWAYDLADMGRVALISFYVGGAALSMAYADEYLLIIALMSTLRQLTKPETMAAMERAREKQALTRPRRTDADDDAQPAGALAAGYAVPGNPPTSRSA